ncbi:MAG: hypothetical protein K2J20_00835 [Bacilli bacterium]|nr:hypothetical protein [Bacilli bacterium]
MEIRRGKVYGLIFISFIVLLAIGGFVLTKILVSDEAISFASEDSQEPAPKQDLRVNQNEDYIYFENADLKSESHEITFQDIIININSNDATDIMNKLNNEMALLKNNLKTISEQELSDEELAKIIYKEDDIYSTTYRDYTRYFYKSYASVLVDEYIFDCIQGSNYGHSISYTFDTATGKLLSYDDVLDIYNLNLIKLKEAVQEQLNKSQTVVEDIEQIDISSTINNLDNSENYALYINKSGFLVLSYLVKSAAGDYNDVIIFN